MNSRISRKIKKQMFVLFPAAILMPLKGTFYFIFNRKELSLIEMSFFLLKWFFLIEMNSKRDINITPSYNALLIWVKRFSEYLAYEI